MLRAAPSIMRMAALSLALAWTVLVGPPALAQGSSNPTNSQIAFSYLPPKSTKYLPMLARDTVGAYALSETGSGSDAFGLACKAEDRGDHYVLNGQKLWITNAFEAGVFIVFANANPNLVLPLDVARELEGPAFGRLHPEFVSLTGVESGAKTWEQVLPSGRAPENIVAFTSDRYSRAPLVIRGPGAGAAITASGIAADLCRLLPHGAH